MSFVSTAVVDLVMLNVTTLVVVFCTMFVDEYPVGNPLDDLAEGVVSSVKLVFARDTGNGYLFK